MVLQISGHLAAFNKHGVRMVAVVTHLAFLRGAGRIIRGEEDEQQRNGACGKRERRASEIDKPGKNQKNQNDADFYRYLPKSQLKMRA
jgi:hypothetical protein